MGRRKLVSPLEGQSDIQRNVFVKYVMKCIHKGVQINV